MTTQEQEIWSAAYGAAFVRDLHDLASDLGGSMGNALARITPERAIRIADLAVRQLRLARDAQEDIGATLLIGILVE